MALRTNSSGIDDRLEGYAEFLSDTGAFWNPRWIALDSEVFGNPVFHVYDLDDADKPRFGQFKLPFRKHRFTPKGPHTKKGREKICLSVTAATVAWAPAGFQRKHNRPYSFGLARHCSKELFFAVETFEELLAWLGAFETVGCTIHRSQVMDVPVVVSEDSSNKPPPPLGRRLSLAGKHGPPDAPPQMFRTSTKVRDPKSESDISDACSVSSSSSDPSHHPGTPNAATARKRATVPKLDLGKPPEADPVPAPLPVKEEVKEADSDVSMDNTCRGLPDTLLLQPVLGFPTPRSAEGHALDNSGASTAAMRCAPAHQQALAAEEADVLTASQLSSRHSFGGEAAHGEISFAAPTPALRRGINYDDLDKASHPSLPAESLAALPVEDEVDKFLGMFAPSPRERLAAPVFGRQDLVASAPERVLPHPALPALTGSADRRVSADEPAPDTTGMKRTEVVRTGTAQKPVPRLRDMGFASSTPLVRHQRPSAQGAELPAAVKRAASCIAAGEVDVEAAFAVSRRTGEFVRHAISVAVPMLEAVQGGPATPIVVGRAVVDLDPNDVEYKTLHALSGVFPGQSPLEPVCYCVVEYMGRKATVRFPNDGASPPPAETSAAVGTVLKIPPGAVSAVDEGQRWLHVAAELPDIRPALDLPAFEDDPVRARAELFTKEGWNPSCLEEARLHIDAAISEVLKALQDPEEPLVSPPELSCIFHSAGVNMRFLGVVAARTTRPYVRRLCVADALGRYLKLVFREAVKRGEDPPGVAFELLDLISGAQSEAASVTVAVKSRFAFDTLDLNDIPQWLLLAHFQHHLGVIRSGEALDPLPRVKYVDYTWLAPFLLPRSDPVQHLGAMVDLEKLALTEPPPRVEADRLWAEIEGALSGGGGGASVIVVHRAPHTGMGDALVSQGHYLASIDRHVEAGSCFATALNVRPDLAPAVVSKVFTWLFDQGQESRAIELYQQTVAAMDTNLGMDHPAALQLHRGMAEQHWSRADYSSAVQPLARALQLCEQGLGEEAVHTAATASLLAHAYRRNGQVNEAIEGFEKARSICEEKGHWTAETGHALFNLAMAYEEAEKAGLAFEAAKECFAVWHHVFGDEDDRTQDGRRLFARMAEKTENFEDALCAWDGIHVELQHSHPADLDSDELIDLRNAATAATIRLAMLVFASQALRDAIQEEASVSAPLVDEEKTVVASLALKFHSRDFPSHFVREMVEATDSDEGARGNLVLLHRWVASMQQLAQASMED